MLLQLLMTNDSGHLSTTDARRDWNADNGIIAIGLEAGMHAGLRLSGRYVLQTLLGRGGMGEVWQGVDDQLGRPVAVKVLREDLSDPELTERFRREARIAARLQHPGITVVHDVGADNGRLFIVMELLRGRDLAAILAREPAGLPIDATVSLTLQAAEALQAAHASQVVHRDLKPANLFVLDGGQLKICDFGIAWAVDSTTNLTVAGQLIGTPDFMSPEQCQGQQVDERSDLYSLGCVLYSLLTGQPPFAGNHLWAILSQHLYAVPTAPQAIRPDIPLGLNDLVLAMLAKDPADRPAGASQVVAALRPLCYTPTVKVESAAKASMRLELTAPGTSGTVTGLQPIGSDGTASAALAGPPSAPSAQSATITRVPRTDAERRQVLRARPHYWEYLYFAGQLLYERDSVEAKYRDHELGYVAAGREAVIEGQSASSIDLLNEFENISEYIRPRFKDAATLAGKMSDIINDKMTLEAAFGGPDEEGDSERLAHLAKRWNSAYEEFLDWAASLRNAGRSSKFRNLLELAARCADEPLSKYRVFVDEYVSQVDGLYDAIPASLAAGESIRISTSIVLSSPKEAINAYVAELNRIRSRFHLEGLL